MVIKLLTVEISLLINYAIFSITNLLIPPRVTIEDSNKAKYFQVLAPWLTFVPFMGAQIVLIEKKIEVIFDYQR